MQAVINEIEIPTSRRAHSAPAGNLTPASEARLAPAVLNALLAQLPVGVMVADPKGGVMYDNEFAHRIVDGGLPYDKAGWPLARALLLGEVVRDEEIDFVLPDGTHRWLRVSATPIRTVADRIDGAVVTFADVTAVKQAAAWQPIIESLYRL